MSFAAQRLTQRSVERLESRRQEAVRVEAQRGEQFRVFERFLATAQSVERAAIDLHDQESLFPPLIMVG